jgi:hypothetical protein
MADAPVESSPGDGIGPSPVADQGIPVFLRLPLRLSLLVFLFKNNPDVRNVIVLGGFMTIIQFVYLVGVIVMVSTSVLYNL